MLLYKAQKRKNPLKKEEVKFYPQVVITSNVKTDTIAKEIAQLSSLSTGDVKNTIDNLVTVMSRYLCNSQSVTLDGLGTFRLSMKNPKSGVATADEVNSQTAKLFVRFIPAGVRNADRTIAKRNLMEGVKCLRYDKAKTETEENSLGS